MAIIRRFDLDADAKLNLKEFKEGIRPVETYSKRDVKEQQSINASTHQSMLSSRTGRSASRNKSLRASASKADYNSTIVSTSRANIEGTTSAQKSSRGRSRPKSSAKKSMLSSRGGDTAEKYDSRTLGRGMPSPSREFRASEAAA